MSALSSGLTQFEALYTVAVTVILRVAPDTCDEPPGCAVKVSPSLLRGTSIGKPKRHHGSDGYECSISLHSTFSLHSTLSLCSTLSLWSGFSLWSTLSLWSGFSLWSTLSLRSDFSSWSKLSL